MELLIFCFGLICFAILLIVFAHEIDKWLNKLFEPKIRAKQKKLAELKDELKEIDELQKDVDKQLKDIDKQLKELYNVLQKER